MTREEMRYEISLVVGRLQRLGRELRNTHERGDEEPAIEYASRDCEDLAVRLDRLTDRLPNLPTREEGQ